MLITYGLRNISLRVASGANCAKLDNDCKSSDSAILLSSADNIGSIWSSKQNRYKTYRSMNWF